MEQIHDGAGRERTMSDNMALSNIPAHAHIRERMDKLIADVKALQFALADLEQAQKPI
jgi:hypothetical protein